MKYLSLIAAFLITIPSALAQADLNVDPGEDAFKRAENLFQSAQTTDGAQAKVNLYQNTIQQLKRYIKKFPNHKNSPAAEYYLAYSYTKVSRLRDARIGFKNLISKYKKGEYVVASARFLAYDASIGKKFKTAAKYYRLVGDQSTVNLEVEEALFREGLCHESLKDLVSATNAFTDTIKKSQITSTYFQQAHLRLGHIFNTKKKYDVALNHFDSIAKKEVDLTIRAEATFFKGLCLYQLTKFKESRAAYEIVLSLPKNKWKPQALVSIMSVSYAEGDYKGVVKAAEMEGVLLTGSLLGKKEILAGQAYLKMKEYRKAVDAFNNVEKKFPNTMEAFEANYRKILCYYNLKSDLVTGQVNQFIIRYGKQFSKHAYMHTALMLQGETLFDGKNYAAAAKVYDQIDVKLIVEANRPSVLYKKAWCYFETKNYKAAVAGFNDFLKAYPNDLRKLRILDVRAKCYVELKNMKSALTDYDAVIKASPGTQLAGAALQASARILKNQEKYGKMVLRYESLIDTIEDLDPVVVLNAHYWAAWGNFKKSNYKEAIPHITKAEKIDKGAYKKQLSLISVLCNYHLKDKVECVKAAKAANLAGIANDIPMGIYRWLGIQCYKSEEFGDAQTFLSLGVTKLRPSDTPVTYWRILTKCQYENKHYKWAIQSVTHALNLETDEGHRVNMELYKALCQYGLNTPELAKATAVASLKKNPTGQTKATLLRLLGDIYFKEQNYKDAAISFGSISEFFEDKVILPYSITMIIKSLEASKRLDDAKVYQKILDKKFPNYKLPEQK